ncbi:NAD(P)H-dependent oxidoreductase [Streptomyces niveus]|uniref:FMN-dependent NADH-azoreductase n=1 Tax=Streptomyces niveus TaxID=193462 RepID=UPI003449E641
MTTHTPSLLHLDSSADDAGESVSRQLTALFAETWRALHGPSGHRHRDLAADPVPLVSSAYATLGRRVERRGAVAPAEVAALAENDAERREWALTLPLIKELLAADTVLIGVPMYNFSIPASLKAWIDRLTFPGAYVDPVTGSSLLRDTRVVVVTARGGGYGPGTPREAYDFQTPYLRTYFGELGVADKNLCFTHAEMTRSGDVPALAGFQEMAVHSLAAARTAMTDLATSAHHR